MKTVAHRIGRRLAAFAASGQDIPRSELRFRLAFVALMCVSAPVALAGRALHWDTVRGVGSGLFVAALIGWSAAVYWRPRKKKRGQAELPASAATPPGVVAAAGGSRVPTSRKRGPERSAEAGASPLARGWRRR